MNFSKTFIDRPIATSLIMSAILLAGIMGFTQLPIAAVPKIDLPTINVNASLPGASPETMASSVATPLERQLAQIPGLTQMTSTSSLGRTNISVQFGLDRDLDAASQDVSAAINAAGGQLPKNLPNPPNYRKNNSADPPVIILGIWSDVLPIDQVDDYTDNILAQQISQFPGVGQVQLIGERKPAVRVQIDPAAIANQGISLEEVRAALSATNVNAPKGTFNGPFKSATLDSNDQLKKAADFRDVVVAYRKGAPVHISDIGTALDGVENAYAAAWAGSHVGLAMIINRVPGANVIETADAIKAALPRLQASLPQSIHIDILGDRTITIRASVADIEFTLVLTMALVVMVIFLFLRKVWATVIPGVVIPLALIGTFGIMYLLNYSLDNLSLMALTIAVGFVVDDAIVMIENIVRYIEQGDSPYQAAIKGAGQIGFTLVTISFSLMAVFIPLLLMGGVVGKLFHEFAVTAMIAVTFSIFISLTLTPTMCARFLGHEEEKHGRMYMALEHFFEWLVNSYARLLRIVLRHQRLTLASVFATIALTGVIFAVIPKGFFPQQDNGNVFAQTEAAQSISYEELARKHRAAMDIIAADPGVQYVGGATGAGPGGGGGNGGNVFITLKPFGQRDASAEQIINRLRPKLAQIPGYNVFLQPRQDINVGGRLSRTLYQYTLQDQDIEELNHWSDVMLEKMKSIPELRDVTTDKQSNAPLMVVKIDRETASRLGITTQQIDDTLYDAFGQRQVSTIFTQLNQYRVVLEVSPQYLKDPTALSKIYVKANTGAMVPLSAFTSFEPSTTALVISHQGQFPSVTLSFNLAPGVALGDAITLVQKIQNDVRLPISVVPTFQGTAQAFQASLATMPYLILAAIVSVYIVLGILYESYIHPLTILSTVPSAGVGALLMLTLFGYPLDMLGLIGVILLIGIVMKNAIMMIDFALEAERTQNLSPEDSIYHAALLRFRPIMMTTMATLFSGIPLMLASGAGSEFRRPLGFAIVGGLILSQMLTLFTTPVVYLYLDRFSNWIKGSKGKEKSPEGRSGAPALFPGAA